MMSQIATNIRNGKKVNPDDIMGGREEPRKSVSVVMTSGAPSKMGARGSVC